MITFLKAHRAEVRVVDTWNIPLAEMVGAHPNRQHVRQTQFLNTGEGYLFSELICHALRMKEADAVTEMIDLGTGSGLPSLRAVWESKQKSTPVQHLTGLDVDPDAIAVAQYNAMVLGVESQANFLCQDIASFLQNNVPKPHGLVATNPLTFPCQMVSTILSSSPYAREKMASNTSRQFSIIPGSLVHCFAFFPVH